MAKKKATKKAPTKKTTKKAPKPKMTIYDELVKATDFEPEDGLDRDAVLESLIEAASELEDNVYAKLSEAAQDWVNSGVESVERGEMIEVPSGCPEFEEEEDLEDEEYEEDDEEEEDLEDDDEEEDLEDDDEEEEEEEEEPAPRRGKKTAKKKGGKAPVKASKKTAKKTSGPRNKVSAFRDAYLAQYCKKKGKVTSKDVDTVLKQLAKKGIEPSRGTASVQVTSVKAIMAWLESHDVVSFD